MLNNFYTFQTAVKGKTGLIFSSVFIFIIVFMAMFASLIANDQPLFVKDNSGFHAPAFSNFFSVSDAKMNDKEWNSDSCSFLIYPLIKYSPGKSDYLNSDFRSPLDEQYKSENGKEISLTFRDRHWLGTDLRGTDVFSGIIHGARVSLMVGFISAILAVMIGIFSGGIAGWFSESGFVTGTGRLFFMLLSVIPVIQIFMNIGFANAALLSVLIVFIFYKAGLSAEKLKFFKKKINIPVDGILLRFIEIFTTFPKIVLILVIAGFTKPSLSSIIFLLVITGWADFARLTRGEFIRIARFPYVDAARLSGAKSFRILIKHMLPNAMVPLMVTFVYAVASYILIEAGLSFLGVGVPSDVVTWGSLLSSGKDNLSAWWLILFPGIFLSFTIASFHRLAEEMKIHLQK